MACRFRTFQLKRTTRTRPSVSGFSHAARCFPGSPACCMLGDSPLFTAETDPTARKHHTSCAHSSAEGRWGCSRFLTNMNEERCRERLCTCFCVNTCLWFLGHVPGRRRAGPRGNSVFGFSRNCQTVFPKWPFYILTSNVWGLRSGKWVLFSKISSLTNLLPSFKKMSLWGK